MAATLCIHACKEADNTSKAGTGPGEKGEPHVWLTLVAATFLSWENAVLHCYRTTLCSGRLRLGDPGLQPSLTWNEYARLGQGCCPALAIWLSATLTRLCTSTAFGPSQARYLACLKPRSSLTTCSSRAGIEVAALSPNASSRRAATCALEPEVCRMAAGRPAQHKQQSKPRGLAAL